MTQAELVQAVKDHAIAHYEKGGWDYVIECYGTEDIVRDMRGATTAEQAIKNVGEAVAVMADVRSDVIGSGGGCPDCLNFREHSLLCPRKGEWRLEEDE